jgi:NitT/TauT family transport system substrate-binding protein
MHRVSRAALLAGGTALVAAPRLAGAQTLETIRFCGVPTDDLTPVFWGMKSGIYARAGIDLQFIPTGSGSAATTAVIAGSYEMGKGSHISSYGAVWEINNAWAMGLVASDAPYKTAADLNGQTIGAAGLNDLSTLGIAAWVDKNGGDSKTLKWVEIPGSAAGAALVEHRIAAAQLNEPQLRSALCAVPQRHRAVVRVDGLLRAAGLGAR